MTPSEAPRPRYINIPIVYSYEEFYSGEPRIDSDANELTVSTRRLAARQAGLEGQRAEAPGSPPSIRGLEDPEERKKCSLRSVAQVLLRGVEPSTPNPSILLHPWNSSTNPPLTGPQSFWPRPQGNPRPSGVMIGLFQRSRPPIGLLGLQELQ